MAETAEPLLKTAVQAEWAARLEAERANLRAAMTWALDNDEPEVALRIAAALAWYWHSRARAVATEGRHVLDEALACTAGARCRRSPAVARLGSGWCGSGRRDPRECSDAGHGEGTDNTERGRLLVSLYTAT